MSGTIKIAIDPGHGMSNRKRGVYDPGAVHVENGVNYEEAAVALKYGLTLKDVFCAKGHEVFMTRDDAQDHAPVVKRAANAKNAAAKALISLHLNSFKDEHSNGLEVLYYRDDNQQLAQKLQDALLKVTGFNDREIKKRDDLAVLKFNGPAVLIELGFIANDNNRATILDDNKRQEICDTIANVVIEHLNA
ncbi:MAG: N-acetylmuramoyl-L-alanine amidase [Acidobacteria bacterium]|jgi:N-acetylmuramoyl-L-alanine amidase|nr:N-acetylmuramoyl-L-alanine amidase [Acidobacteriota bacterium]